MRFDAASPELPVRLRSFLQALWCRPVVVDALRRFPAGMSWITIGFTAHVGAGPGDVEHRELILRIGDPSGLLAPYRAEPEFVVLRALAGQANLPVPEAVAFSDDPGVLGAPFLVTQRVVGDTPMPWKGADLDRDDAANRSLGRDFADGLGAIHAFDWQRSPLATLFPSVPLADVAANQVRVWAKHADVPSGGGPPQMHYAMRWLEAHAPVADRATIVHGDYRVGNFLQQAGRITAILDWELMHVGDPHEDLAWAGLRTFSAGTGRIGGLIEREEFHERYRRRTGFTVRPEVIRYYEVLVQFKMAAMLIGAVRQIESGRARDVRMAAMGFQLAPTLLELNRLIGEASPADGVLPHRPNPPRGAGRAQQEPGGPMSPSLVGLLEGVRRSLRDDVQNELSSEHARTQLAGVLDILGKLERMVAWSPDALRERLDAMEAGCATVESRAVAAGYPAPTAALPGLPAPLRQADLEQALRRSEQRLAALADWLFDPAAGLPPALRHGLDALLRAALRSALVVERRRVPRADYSSMTGVPTRADSGLSKEQ